MPGVAELTATVGSELNSDSVSLSFTLNEPRKVKELISVGPPGYPEQEFSALATIVSARTGEPLPDVWVKWDFPGVSIAPSKTNSNGIAGATFKLPFIKQGLLEAVVEGGIGGWDAKSLMVAVDTFQLLRLNAPSGEIVGVGELTLVYAKVVSSVTQRPVEGAEVFWLKDGIEQNPWTKTNERGETHKNFTAQVAGEMKIEAQIRDPDGAPFDTGLLTFSVIGPL